MANLKLSIAYQNVRGLRTKSNEFFSNSTICNYDVICITETWLNDSFYDGEYFDQNYVVYRDDRDVIASGRSRGGGVAMAVRRELCSARAAGAPDRPALADELWISIPLLKSNQQRRRAMPGVPRPRDTTARISSTTATAPHAEPAPAALHIILTYIPHGRNHLDRLSAFYDRVYNYMDCHSNDVFIILGDFNVTNGEWKPDNLTSNLVLLPNEDELVCATSDFMSLSHLRQYNFISNINNRYLDLIFSNTYCEINRSINPLTPEDTNHPALDILLLFETFTPFQYNSESRIPQFHFADYDAINIELRKINWLEEFRIRNDIESVVGFFYTVLNNLIKLYVPCRKKTTPKHYAPWVTRPLIKLLNEKRKYHRNWKRYGCKLDYNTFSLLRTRAKHLESCCYETYKRITEENIKKNPKYFWTYVNSKKLSSGLPQKLTYKDISSSDGVTICNLFNEYFTSVFVDPSVNSDNSLIKYSNHNFSSLDINSINITEKIVERELKMINISKGAGSDGIHPLLINKCAKELVFPVTYIFKNSISEGVFPKVWKKSLITPIPKNDKKDDITQYRPISKLCIFGKILEKIVTHQLSFTLRNYIIPNQHGFFRGRSVETNLVTFTDFLLDAMDKNLQVDVMYSDFSKAFDKINHNLLLDKLSKAGVHGDLLRWIKSYISNRLQAVSIKGFISDYRSVSSGIPQGSHLGPLLFNFYINDIGNNLSNSNYLLYADDAKIFNVIRNESDCVSLQRNITALAEYCSENQLFLNVNKCFIISYTRKRNVITYNYHLNNSKLTRVQKIRDLGVILDANLSFTDHYDHIIKKSFQQLGFLLRTCKPFKKVDTYKILYFSLVRSVLDFCSVVWSPFYACHINRIERIQKTFLRTLHYRTGTEYISYPNSLTTYNMLPLNLRRQQFDLMFLFKIINNIIDSPNLLEKIKLKVPLKSVRRTNYLFAVSLRKFNYTSNHFFYRSSSLYNKKMSHVDPFFLKKLKFKKCVINELKTLIQ